MAKSPTTVAGAHPLSDLLFSPRAAFIWNHTRKNVVWMNPAARAAFALRLEDFSASLPAGLIRRFAQFAERKVGGTVKVQIPGVPGLKCSIEILKLADGQDGLIVAELGEGEEFGSPPAPSTVRKPAKVPKKPLRKAVTRQRRTAPKAPPTLTAEEMRAFKAVGRKVLRLCEEKKHSKGAAAAVSLPLPAPSDVIISPERPAHALRDILAAFDLVLFLGERLDIVGIQGHAARLGLRKAKLTGKSVGDLVLPHDRAMRRMAKKLQRQAAYGSRDALLICGENGNAKPCRAILGRWEGDDAAFFLALLSLDPPASLRRTQRADSVAAARLAA